MSDNVKVALILAVTALIVLGIWLYFSPYYSCLRADFSELQCARAAGGASS